MEHMGFIVLVAAVVFGAVHGKLAKNCEERVEEYRKARIVLSRCNWDSRLCQACISVNTIGSVNVTEIFKKKCVLSEDGRTAVACHPEYKGPYWYRDFCVNPLSKLFLYYNVECSRSSLPPFYSVQHLSQCHISHDCFRPTGRVIL